MMSNDVGDNTGRETAHIIEELQAELECLKTDYQSALNLIDLYQTWLTESEDKRKALDLVCRIRAKELQEVRQ